MAQNVTVAGASYSDVPSVALPKTGGGTSSFYDVSDTTAAASDVASGKYFYTAAGVKTEGTSSGGGATNVVTGTFTTSSTTGAAQTIDIPYTGSGHPNFIGIYPGDGYVNGSSLYDLTHQYATIEIAIFRENVYTYADYTGTGSNNHGYVSLMYKSTTATGTTASRTNDATIFTSSAATAAAGTSVRMSSNKKMSIFVSSNSYGFLASTTYRYVIVYSS